MSSLLHRDARSIFPDLMDWFESPFVALRPYLGQPVRIEDFVEDGRYVVRAELAGIDPAKDLEVMTEGGCLTIRAERIDKSEGKHRSEFRYGSFSRTLPLPETADQGKVTAEYHDGILTITIGLIEKEKESAKKIEITTGG